MLTEHGPENRKSRITAASFYGRPSCSCCGGWDSKGNRVGCRYSDMYVRARDHRRKSDEVRRWNGKKGMTLRDHRS